MRFRVLLLPLEDFRNRNDLRKLIEIATVINIIQTQFTHLDDQTEAAIKLIKNINDNQSTFDQALFIYRRNEYT